MGGFDPSMVPDIGKQSYGLDKIKDINRQILEGSGHADDVAANEAAVDLLYYQQNQEPPIQPQQETYQQPVQSESYSQNQVQQAPKSAAELESTDFSQETKDATPTSNLTMVGDGGYLVDYGVPETQAKPSEAYIPNYWEEEEEDEGFVNDLGQLQYLGGPQAGAGTPDFSPFVDYATKFDTATNKKYEDLFDQEAQRKLDTNYMNSQYAGDGGYIIDPLTGMAPASIEMGADSYNGKDLIDDLKTDTEGNRIGFTSADAHSSYMTPEAAQWYIDQGFFDDAKGAAQWLKENPAAGAVSKAMMEDEFGFHPYETNLGDRLKGDLNRENEYIAQAANNLANLRADNTKFTANLESGKQIQVDKDLRTEMANLLEQRNASRGYMLPDGQFLPETQIQATIAETGQQPFYMHRGNDWYLMFDNERGYYLGEGKQPPELQETGYENIKTSDGTEWTDDDIKNNFKDLGILKWFIDPNTKDKDVAEATKNLQDEAGSKADFGWFNWNMPKEYMSEHMLDDPQNLVPRIADMALSSAPYFSPYTAVPLGLSQMAGDLQGVQMMGHGNKDFGTVENSAVAVPMQGLATLGEMALGGGMAGRIGAGEGRGLYETLGDAAWKGLGKTSPNPLERNALTRTLRQGIDEGLEEVTTSPLYEAAENGFTNMYANDAVDKYGWNTGEKDYTTSQGHFRNWLETIPDDFFGGFLLGGPMGGLQEMSPRHRHEANARYQKNKAMDAAGLHVPQVDDYLLRKGVNNG